MNPMFTLNGQVIHVFESPKGVNKQTGEEYGGQDKVQILGDIPVGENQFKKEIVTLTTNLGEKLTGAIGRPVSCPVAFWAKADKVGFYIPKNAEVSIQ